MANLFELMSGRKPSYEAEMKKCSVVLHRTFAIKESVNSVSTGHTEASGCAEKGLLSSREMHVPVTSRGKNPRPYDARTRSVPMDHTGVRCEEMIWSEGQQQRVSSFTIPKKRRENKDLLVDLPLTSRECHQEVLPTLVKSYRHPSSQGAFSYTEVKSVSNKDLLNKYGSSWIFPLALMLVDDDDINFLPPDQQGVHIGSSHMAKCVNNLSKFLEKRRELRQMGYSDKELLDSYAFLYARTAQEVETICRNGIQVGNSCVSCLGHPEMGVQLCRYSDVLKQEPFQYGQAGYIIIFKVMKGKIKTVTENRSSVYLEPTPNYDCHISKSTLTENTTVSPKREYESTQIYLYEYGDLEVLPSPRHICPLFVVKCTYISREIKHSGKHVTPAARPCVNHPASTRNTGPQILTATTTTTSIINLQSACGFAVSNSIPSSSISTWAQQPAASKGEENGTVVWSGKLCLAGDLACLVDLVSRSSNLKPAHLGTAIDIKMRMKRETAKAKFLSQVKALRRNADVFINSQYYSVCYLKPRADDSTSRFQVVVKYLSKTDSVGVIHEDAANLLLIMPIGKLSEMLGLFQDRNPNFQLCCVFISPKPRRQVLRTIRAESSVGHLQTSADLAAAQDLPPAQMVRHAVSWFPGKDKGTELQNLSVPDYDRGFQATFPKNFLVSKALLHDLFVEQILIQRQHNSVTGAVHVPSKLYGEKADIESVVVSKMDTPKSCIPEVLPGAWNKKPITNEEDEQIFKDKVCERGPKVYCSSLSCEMSPTIISPDTTFPDHDPKVNPLGALKVIEPTLESTVSSTVCDLTTSVSPDTLTDELAEQIVRGFRPNLNHGCADDKKVNLRDPRKRKLLETLSKVANGHLNTVETDSAKKSCYKLEQMQANGHVELDSKKSTLLSVTSSVLALENSSVFSDPDLGSFSPELSESKQENSANGIVKNIPSKQTIQNTPMSLETHKKGVEPDVVTTALDMKQLLDSDLENPNLKANDGSEDEFEEPSSEEISDALDRRLLIDSLKRNMKTSKSIGPELLTTGLRVTVNNKVDSSVISSAGDMKSFLNLNVSCADSVETPAGFKLVSGEISEVVSTSQNQSKQPSLIQRTPSKGDSVNLIKRPVREDSPGIILQTESKLKSLAKRPVLGKDNKCKLQKKPVPRGGTQDDRPDISKRSSYPSNLSKNDAHGLNDSAGAPSYRTCPLETSGVKGAVALSTDESDLTFQRKPGHPYLCVSPPKRPPICELFPGSSCSKTIPAGFFSDAQCLVTVPKGSGPVVFEEDVVMSDLAGNLRAKDLLVFLTNVAQKYNHFVGDYIKQAGLDEILLDSGLITPRKISVGILYPDMTVTLPNDTQGEDDLTVCVFEVLHGKIQSIPLPDDEKTEVSDCVKCVIHAKIFANKDERYVELTGTDMPENVGLHRDKSSMAKYGDDITPCNGQAQLDPISKACDGVPNQLQENIGLPRNEFKKETLLTKVSFLPGTTGREGAKSSREAVHDSLVLTVDAMDSQNVSVTSDTSSGQPKLPKDMASSSSGRKHQIPVSDVHLEKSEKASCSDISSLSEPKLCLYKCNDEEDTCHEHLETVKQGTIDSTCMRPNSCIPVHSLDEAVPSVSLVQISNPSCKYSGGCIPVMSASSAGTDVLHSCECIPGSKQKASAKDGTKLTKQDAPASNRPPVMEKHAGEEHLVCQEQLTTKTKVTDQIKPMDRQKHESPKGITKPLKVSCTRRCDEQRSDKAQVSRQYCDRSMKNTDEKRPNNKHVPDIVATATCGDKSETNIIGTEVEESRSLSKTKVIIPAKSFCERPSSMARHNFMFKFMQKLSNDKETAIDKTKMERSIAQKILPNKGLMKQQNVHKCSSLNSVKPVVKFKRTFQTVEPEVADNDCNVKESLSKSCKSSETKPGSLLPPKILFSQFKLDTKSSLMKENQTSIRQNDNQMSPTDCSSMDTDLVARDQNKKRKSSESAETPQVWSDCSLQRNLSHTNWWPGYKKQKYSEEDSSDPGLKQTCFSDLDRAMNPKPECILQGVGVELDHLVSKCDSWPLFDDTCGNPSILSKVAGTLVDVNNVVNDTPLTRTESLVKKARNEDSFPMVEKQGSELYDPFNLDDRSLSPPLSDCFADTDSSGISCATPWIPTSKADIEVKEEIAPKLDFLFSSGLNCSSITLGNLQHHSPQARSNSMCLEGKALNEKSRDDYLVTWDKISSSVSHKEHNADFQRTGREMRVDQPSSTAQHCAINVISQQENSRENKGSLIQSKRPSRWGKPLFEEPDPLDVKESIEKKPSVLCEKPPKMVDPVGKSINPGPSFSTSAIQGTHLTAVTHKCNPESVTSSNSDLVFPRRDKSNPILDKTKTTSREWKNPAQVERFCDTYSSAFLKRPACDCPDSRVVTGSPLSTEWAIPSTNVVQPSEKAFHVSVGTACPLPAQTLSSPHGILPVAGGILIPEDSVFLESSPDHLERVLNHLKKRRERGCDLTMKVHSQQICKLATKRQIFKEGSPANAQACGVLRLLTHFIKEGVVELLQQHSCDSSPFLSAQESVACASDLNKQLCVANQATVLLSKSGDSNLQRMAHECGLWTATFEGLLGICSD